MAVEKEVEVKVEKEVKEDEAHQAFRAIVEAYKLKNPEKYEMKKAAFEKKLKGKLAFGLTETGARDGSIIEVK